MLVDSKEYSDYFGEETVPICADWVKKPKNAATGVQDLLNYSAPFRVPQFITLFADYERPLPDHPYGSGNDPLEIQFGGRSFRKTRNYTDQRLVRIRSAS